MTLPRMLIAGIHESNRRLHAMFSDWQVSVVTTMDEALAALKDPYDVILVAVRFDESRMFDLLRYLKSDGRLAHIPVICYRSAPGPVTATELARQAIELASRSLGACEFIDLAGNSNAEHGNWKLREAVSRTAASRGEDDRKA